MAAKKSIRTSSVWAARPAPTRGPKPSLSIDQIARIAIRIADIEGLPSLTMQRLAHELGLTTMALYRYIPGKADLVAVMIDFAADSPLDFGKPSLSWNARLKNWARRCLAIYEDHPWFLEATTTRQTPFGPNELSWMEAALAMLAESGLRPKGRHRAFLAIIGHVRGHATFHQIRTSSGDGKEWPRDLVQIMQPQSHRFPTLLQGLSSGVFSENIEGAFDFGLDCIVDGIRARVSGRTAKLIGNLEAVR